MMGDDGRIKVLDFGLAKPAGGFSGESADSELKTKTKTQEGAIIGTVHFSGRIQLALPRVPG